MVDRPLEQLVELLQQYPIERWLIVVVIGSFVFAAGWLILKVVGRVLSVVFLVLFWVLGTATAIFLLESDRDLGSLIDELGRYRELVIVALR